MIFDKPVVTASDIQEILKPYDLGEVIHSESLGGVPNTTFKVQTDRQDVAVRIYSIGQSSLEHIKIEHEILSQLTEKGFMTTHPIAGRNGIFLQYWGKYPLLVTKFIEGEMAENKPLNKRLSYNIGALLNTFRRSMESVKIEKIPKEEYLLTKSAGILATLDSDLEKRGWEMDISRVKMQWERSRKIISQHFDELNPSIIHSDFWPPNIKCVGDEIVGLMDFDDWTYGPAVFDLVVAFQECSMFGGAKIDHEVAENILRGYFETGGSLSTTEEMIFPDAIELFCSLFLAYNIVQAETYEEADIYLQRLKILADEKTNGEFRKEVADLIALGRTISS